MDEAEVEEEEVEVERVGEGSEVELVEGDGDGVGVVKEAFTPGEEEARRVVVVVVEGVAEAATTTGDGEGLAGTVVKRGVLSQAMEMVQLQAEEAASARRGAAKGEEKVRKVALLAAR